MECFIKHNMPDPQTPPPLSKKLLLGYTAANNSAEFRLGCVTYTGLINLLIKVLLEFITNMHMEQEYPDSLEILQFYYYAPLTATKRTRRLQGKNL